MKEPITGLHVSRFYFVTVIESEIEYAFTLVKDFCFHFIMTF